MSKDILKKYVCKHPFTYLDVNHFGTYLCCPSWLPTDISDLHGDNPIGITEAWYGEKAERIRDSVMDGSYSYCDHKVCPALNTLLKGEEVPDVFVPIEEFERPENPMPEEILYGQDRSCQMKCPSCRIDIIPNAKIDSAEHKRKQEIQDEIEESFGEGIQKILLTGSGDPIYSKIYRDFLINFDARKYPSLESIQLVTNGVLLNEKMWNSFNCQEYINVIDISIDAGTKETYENVTRLGGDWDRLLENIEFLASLDDIERALIFSYVVSEYNYNEMHLLYEILEDIFSRVNSRSRFFLNYRQHVYWGTGAYSADQVNQISVFNKDHPKHDDFLIEVCKIDGLERVGHNFHHLL